MGNGKIRIYTEIGFGNSTFINTEKEYPDGHEERVPGFIKMDLKHRLKIGAISKH